MKAGHKHQIAFAGPKEAKAQETYDSGHGEAMGAVNNLSQWVEKFDGADNRVDVFLLGFPPALLSLWNTCCKGCCMVTVEGVLQ